MKLPVADMSEPNVKSSANVGLKSPVKSKFTANCSTKEMMTAEVNVPKHANMVMGCK